MARPGARRSPGHGCAPPPRRARAAVRGGRRRDAHRPRGRPRGRGRARLCRAARRQLGAGASGVEEGCRRRVRGRAVLRGVRAARRGAHAAAGADRRLPTPPLLRRRRLPPPDPRGRGDRRLVQRLCARDAHRAAVLVLLLPAVRLDEALDICVLQPAAHVRAPAPGAPGATRAPVLGKRAQRPGWRSWTHLTRAALRVRAWAVVAARAQGPQCARGVVHGRRGARQPRHEPAVGARSARAGGPPRLARRRARTNRPPPAARPSAGRGR